MPVISMKQLLEAGVHFGHQTRKWNPKMKKYIFTARNDIHIINLEDTVVLAEKAYNYVRDLVKTGKTVLFVGTKKQATEAVEQEAKRCGMFYVNNRWLGGTLTNFKTIRSSVDRMKKIEQMEKTGEFELLPKKEVLKLKQAHEKLARNLNGIREMTSMPGIIFLVDSKKENIAIKEARLMGIPLVGLIDTNCDPEDVDVCIPGNDDAIRAIKLIVGSIADAVIEAKEGVVVDRSTFDNEPVDIEKALSQIDLSLTGDMETGDDYSKAKGKKPFDKKAKPVAKVEAKPVAKEVKAEKPVMAATPKADAKVEAKAEAKKTESKKVEAKKAEAKADAKKAEAKPKAAKVEKKAEPKAKAEAKAAPKKAEAKKVAEKPKAAKAEKKAEPKAKAEAKKVVKAEKPKAAKKEVKAKEEKKAAKK